jgi:NhaP-type Na+/H+ or K+/H+ antiporter
MKRFLMKIEKFFISISTFVGFFVAPGDFQGPKKKDYLGRFIYSVLGIILLLFLFGILYGLVLSLF